MDHFGNQLVESDFRCPTQLGFGFAGITDWLLCKIWIMTMPFRVRGEY